MDGFTILILLLTAAVTVFVVMRSRKGKDSVTPQPRPKPIRSFGLMDPRSWDIGPTIGGKRYSVGVPEQPSRHAEGWQFEFPVAPGHVNYVTVDPGSLKGKTALRFQFRIEGDPGVELVGEESPDRPTMISGFIQRKGDNWSAKGEFEAYRWWCRTHRVDAPQVGQSYDLVVPFDGEWGAVQTSRTDAGQRAAFEAALANVDRVGITWADNTGLGHGAFATGKARFIMTGFEVI